MNFFIKTIIIQIKKKVFYLLCLGEDFKSKTFLIKDSSAILISSFVVLIFLVGCSKISSKKNTLQGLFKQSSGKKNAQIYIRENNVYTPYIVINDSYKGNMLILRKYILEELTSYKNNNIDLKNIQNPSSHHFDSCVDEYLNNIFLKTLTKNLQGAIVSIPIELSGGNTLLSQQNPIPVDKKVEKIERKVFLLSFPYMELPQNIEEETNNPLPIIEKVLSVFSSADELALRPAFYLPKKTKISIRSDIVEGEEVYSLDLDLK